MAQSLQFYFHTHAFLGLLWIKIEYGSDCIATSEPLVGCDRAPSIQSKRTDQKSLLGVYNNDIINKIIVPFLNL